MVITGADKKGAVIIMDMGKYIAEANRRLETSLVIKTAEWSNIMTQVICKW